MLVVQRPQWYYINGIIRIVEQMGVQSTSGWGAFLRSVTPDRRPGDYQHAACRILNGIAKRTETTLQALPPGTLGKAQALAALQAFKQALKDETCGIPLRERLPSASKATEKDFDLKSTKVFLTSPPFQRQFVDCLKRACPHSEDPPRPRRAAHNLGARPAARACACRPRHAAHNLVARRTTRERGP